MTGGFLIVRRDGALWGLPAEQVLSIARVESVAAQIGDVPAPSPAARGIELRLAGGGCLAVDAVLTLAGDLRIRPLSARLRRFLPQESSALAMLAGEPMVLMTREGGVPHV